MKNSLVTVSPSQLLFIVIGCGGIGGNLARDLPKLLIDSPHKLMLIDGDIVDINNIKRQPYQIQDLNKNKARVLATKINSFYTISALYFDRYLTSIELTDLCKKYNEYVPVFLGCVDNDQTRKIIEQNFMKQKVGYLIDGANSEFDGNVFVKFKNGRKKFGKMRSEVYELANDHNPGLIGCEDQVAKGNTQILITNEKIAIAMLEHVYSIITGKIYVGVTDVGRFKTVHY